MATFDVKFTSVELPELPEAAARPIYAGLGATDLAVEKVRSYVTDVQARLTAKVADVQGDVTTRVADVQKQVKGLELPEPRTLQDKALTLVAQGRKEAEARLAELQSEAKALPTKVQTTVRSQYDHNRALVTTTYAGLADRGETVVRRVRKGETAAPVEVTRKQPQKGTPATSAPAQRSTAKKAPATRSTAKKAGTKAPAKQTAAKKAPTGKTAAS